MSMTRRVLALITVAIAFSAFVRAQRPQPTFDAASIKPFVSVSDPSVINDRMPGRFTATNSALQLILLYAFKLRDHELVDVPDWVRSTRYNITATYPPSDPVNRDDVRTRVQALLRERFALASHPETRELPVYFLTVARKDGKLGPQLMASSVDCTGKQPDLIGGSPSPVAPSGNRPSCGMIAARQFITGGSRPISELATNLELGAGRPVLDRTGLAGTFDIDVKWSPAASVSAASADDASLFVALEEQLGLKLESGKAPFDVLVIDHIERPTGD